MSSKKSMNPNTMSKKELDAILDAEDKSTQAKKPKKSKKAKAAAVPFPIFAVLAAAGPTYLFQTNMYDLPILENAVVYGIVVAATIAFLYLSYAKASARSTKAGSVLTAYSAYSVILTKNLVFFVLFYFLSLYILPRFPVELGSVIEFGASSIGAAAAVYALDL